MTYSATGYIRDYNPTADTATVELIGLGILDVWLDGCAINAGVNRGYLTHGALVTLAIPDPHRLCEALITAIGASPASAGIVSSGALQSQQTGRIRIPTDGSGNGSAAITFAPAFSTAPMLYAGADDAVPIHIGIPTTAGATISISGGPHSTNVYVTWYALGNA